MKAICFAFVLLCVAAVSAQVCNTTGDRDPCGFIGVNKDSCVSQLGCCWDESSVPYCFQAASTPTSTQVTASSTASSGSGPGSGTVTFGNNSWTTTYQFTGGVSFCSQCGQPGEYQCSSTNIGGNLSAGSFLPSNSFMTSLTVEILGSYGCASTTFTEIVVYLNGVPFSSVDLSASSCVCNTCDGKITLPSVTFPLGSSYPDDPQLTINIFGNSICLAEASLTVTYAATQGFNAVNLPGIIPAGIGSSLVCGIYGAYSISSSASTLATFSDPLPSGKLVVGLAFEILGNFFYTSPSFTPYCKSSTSATFSLGGNVFTTASVSRGSSQTQQQLLPNCNSPVYSNSGCNSPWVVTSPFYQAGIKGYTYGGTNTITIQNSDAYGSMQIAKVNIVLYYI